MIDRGGEALRRLGVHAVSDAAQYLVRPDGHIGFRCAGRDLQAVAGYLEGVVHLSRNSAAKSTGS
jgi:hypothetical protein